jgi:hypothetical protein
MSDQIQTYNVQKLFTSGEYVIPIYQRNYAWEEPEISQLIQDIYDFATSDKKDSGYYIGTLVVYDRHLKNEKVLYETIDGQQRLTTLNILVNVFNRAFKSEIQEPIDYRLNLSFDSRKKSMETLEVIARDTSALQYDQSKDYSPNIQQAYADAEKKLKKLLRSPEQVAAFYNFLAHKVRIMRVSVPHDTDLNHYFEIMNTRGEQLEKHEILKAKLLEVIHEDKALSYTFNLIWEACADMERYVQYGFNIEQRHALFSKNDWNKIAATTLEEIAQLVYPLKDSGQSNYGNFKHSLVEIIEHPEHFGKTDQQDEEAPDRFTSVINFSNFLLHVLRIQTEEDISLDDKRLLDLFDEQLNSRSTLEKITFVKAFGANLLWCKWLFDNYIIKREFIREKDQWSLKRLKWYKGNKVSYVNTFGSEKDTNGVNQELIMLLSMFHVSTPTLVYKHWLNAALYHVFSQYKGSLASSVAINPQNYLEYLTQLARAFLYDRYLSIQPGVVEYYDIIYRNGGRPQNADKPEYINLEVLHSGTLVENFIFNFLDFILWKEGVDGAEQFDFAFRSSVEHYYPQNPIAKDYKIEQSICDQFGNLCLISRSKNSKLSNLLPEGKKDHYLKTGPDSLKQSEMMKEPKWETEEIQSHGQKMIEKLLKF